MAGSLLYGPGVAIVEIPGNLVQAGSAVLLSSLVVYAIRRGRNLFSIAFSFFPAFLYGGELLLLPQVEIAENDELSGEYLERFFPQSEGCILVR